MTLRGNELIRTDSETCGIERLEAHFRAEGYSPHRHDTYAIGITSWGCQTFRYRGVQRYGLPGQCHILHPDELHDGRPATDAGFGYRIVHIDPFLIQQALNGRPLPFVENPIVDLPPDEHRLLSQVCDLEHAIDAIERVEVATFIADMLEGLSRRRPKAVGLLAIESLIRVREAIAARPAIRYAVQELETIAGIDRWSLARQFRAAFGTSPSRFRTMRQLDEVRRLTNGGASLVDASMEAGFSDQSHMSRMFKRAFGMTPAQWSKATTQSFP
jgi:AraC-like DNA-binding protein